MHYYRWVRYSIWCILLMMITMGLYGLFQVKYHVQSMYLEVAELRRQLQEEEQSMHVLRAEWAYLTAPERLQTLCQKYLSHLTYVAHAQLRPWNGAASIDSSPDALSKVGTLHANGLVDDAAFDHEASVIVPVSLGSSSSIDPVNHLHSISRSAQAWLVLSSSFRERFAHEYLEEDDGEFYPPSSTIRSGS